MWATCPWKVRWDEGVYSRCRAWLRVDMVRQRSSIQPSENAGPPLPRLIREQPGMVTRMGVNRDRISQKPMRTERSPGLTWDYPWNRLGPRRLLGIGWRVNYYLRRLVWVRHKDMREPLSGMRMGAKSKPETAEKPQMPSGAQIHKTPKERESDRL